MTKKRKPRERRHVCVCCNNEFWSAAPNAKYCKEPSCVEKRKREQQAVEMERRKTENLSYKKQGRSVQLSHRKCQHEFQDGRVCGRPTGRNYFFCERCLGMVEDYGMVRGVAL